MTPDMRAVTTTVITCLGLSSCGWWAVPQPSTTLDLPAPAAWSAANSGHHGRIATGWLSQFHNRELESIVSQALANNHDLKIAAARLREARADTIVASAPLLPSAGISSGSSVTDAPDAPTRRNQTLGLALAWELDLWGRLRNRRAQALANERATIHDYRAARLSLAATTAKAWCNLISAQQEVTLAEATLDSFEKNFRVIERNFKAGDGDALDIAFGRNNVSSAQRALEARRLELDDAARSLELLLGRHPAGTQRSTSTLPDISARVPAGLPADLLDRRPDLCAARERLLASVEAAHAARKALLPSLSLTAGTGNAAANFSRLLNFDSLVHTLSGRLTQTLTEGGAVTAEARAAVERNQAQLHRYAQAALEALRDVESTLAADRSLATQQVFLALELEQAVLAEKLAERNYTEGINPNILSMLEAQRRANNARASMIRLQNRSVQNRIDLHLALGGDFDTHER